MKKHSRRLIPTDRCLDEAAKALGEDQCSPKLRGAIRKICADYLSSSTALPRERRRFATKHLAAIEKTARILSHSLKASVGPDIPGGVEDELAFMLFFQSGGRYDYAAIRKLSIAINDLGRVAARARQAYRPDRGGPEPDVEFHVAIAKLKAVFESIAGKSASVTWNEYRGRFEGKFLAFTGPIEASLAEAVGKRPRTNSALGKLLKAVTRKRPK